jgi:hypothetical protein
MRQELVIHFLEALQLIDLLSSPPQSGEADEGGRLLTAAALKATLQFVAAFGGESQTLRRLLGGLDELGQGHTDPLFIPETISNRKRDPRNVFTLRAVAAVALQCLFDRSEDLKGSATKVARELANEKVPGLQPKASTIIKWRASATAPFPDKELAEHYNFLLPLLRSRANPGRDAIKVMRMLAGRMT